jgi:hypothetical protein
MQIVERNYWWPQLCQEVKDYVQGCADCQRHKVNNRPTKAPLRPIYPKPEAMPFETIALDFITKLPESQGYDSILTVTDTTAPRQPYSYHVEKRSMQKEQRHFTSNTCSHTSDCHGRLSAIETPDSCQSSCKKYAVSQESNEIRPRRITQGPMGNQSAPINGSRPLSGSFPTTIRQIGLLIFLSHNSRTTIGQARPRGSLHFSF